MARPKKSDTEAEKGTVGLEEAPENIKSPMELRLELLERQLMTQSKQLAAAMEVIASKDERLQEWEDEIKRTPKAKKERKQRTEPIPMVLGRFRNLKKGEHGQAIEFYKQQDHFRIQDNTDYCMTEDLYDHLNSVVTPVYEKDAFGNYQRTDRVQNVYFVQIIDRFWKDPKTKHYFKLEKRDGEEVRVPYNPDGKDALQPIKERA